jgi:hypothetical protein
VSLGVIGVGIVVYAIAATALEPPMEGQVATYGAGNEIYFDETTVAESTVKDVGDALELSLLFNPAESGRYVKLEQDEQGFKVIFPFSPEYMDEEMRQLFLAEETALQTRTRENVRLVMMEVTLEGTTFREVE